MGFVAGRYESPDTFHWMWAAIGLLIFLYFVPTVFTIATVQEPDAAATAELNRAPAGPAAEPPRTPDPRDRFLPPGFGWYLTSRFLFLAATGVIETFGLFYLQDVIEVDSPAEAAGFLSIIFGAAALLGAVGTARTSDRIGHRHLIAISGLLGAIGIAVLLITDSLLEVIAGGMIIGRSGWSLLQRRLGTCDLSGGSGQSSTAHGAHRYRHCRRSGCRALAGIRSGRAEHGSQ